MCIRHEFFGTLSKTRILRLTDRKPKSALLYGAAHRCAYPASEDEGDEILSAVGEGLAKLVLVPAGGGHRAAGEIGGHTQGGEEGVELLGGQGDAQPRDDLEEVCHERHMTRNRSTVREGTRYDTWAGVRGPGDSQCGMVTRGKRPPVGIW